MTLVNLKLEEVFRTEGLPEFTFVPPPNYNEILLDVRQSHKPVILEGQSGTGKTSCVRHILAELDPTKKPEYLTARDPFHVRIIEKVVTTHSPGSYVIDDFHRLAIDPAEADRGRCQALSRPAAVRPPEAHHHRQQSSRDATHSTRARHREAHRHPSHLTGTATGYRQAHSERLRTTQHKDKGCGRHLYRDPRRLLAHTANLPIHLRGRRRARDAGKPDGGDFFTRRPTAARRGQAPLRLLSGGKRILSRTALPTK